MENQRFQRLLLRWAWTQPVAVKARCLGSLSLRCLMWGTHPSLPREKLQVCDSLMIMDYGTVSPPLLTTAVWLFLVCRCKAPAQLVSRVVVFCWCFFVFFFEEIVPHAAVDPVCPWEEVNSRLFLCRHLGLPPLSLMFALTLALVSIFPCREG